VDRRLSRAVPGRSGRSGRLALSRQLSLAGAFGFIVLGVGNSVLGVAWPSIRESFGNRLSALSVLLVAGAAGYLATTVPSGRVLNRWGLVRTLVVASVVAAAGCGIVCAAPAFWLLAVGTFVLGIAFGAVDAGLNTVVANAGSNRALSLIHGAFGVGTVVGPILATVAIVAGGSWRIAYGVLAVAEVGCALAWHAARRAIGAADVPPVHGMPAAAAAVTGPPAPSGAVAALAVGIGLLYTGAELSAGQWAASYLQAVDGLSVAATGLVVAAYWGTYALVRLVFAAADAELSSPLTTLVGCCVALAGGLLIWWQHSAGTTVAGLVAVGGGLAPIFPALLRRTSVRFGSARARHLIGWQLAAAGAGGMGVAALVGIALGRFGLTWLGPLLTCLLGGLLLSNIVLDLSVGHGRASRNG
jgi:fucose permease